MTAIAKPTSAAESPRSCRNSEMNGKNAATTNPKRMNRT
jgi:hypothetical protein